MLGNWLLDRDLSYNMQGASLLAPHIAHAFLASSSDASQADYKPKALQILKRRSLRCGLLGIPIWSDGGGPGCEHWTLLVLRRFAQEGGDEVVFRYYDSANKLSPLNASSALLFLEALGVDYPLLGLKRSNRACQANGLDCGLFLLHYWEAEVRRFVGQGWTAPYPQTAGCILKRRQRLINLCNQARKADAEEGKVAGEGRGRGRGRGSGKVSVGSSAASSKDAPPEIVVLDQSVCTKEQFALSAYEKLATEAKNQGLVRFYGCPKCRWSRGGCISYRCNPDKFEAHYAKFPEKYKAGAKDLEEKVEGALQDKELVGGFSRTIRPPTDFF